MKNILFLLFFFYSYVVVASFTAKSSLLWVSSLAEKANCTIKNKDFLKEVEGFKFTHTIHAGAKVAKDIKALPSIKIATYKTKNPFSKAIATTYPSDKETVYLNLRANPRDMESMVNTVCHEATHILGYSHGDNSPKGKENSVPYKVGSLCQKYFKNCK